MGGCTHYQIIVEGHVEDTWKNWFEGLELQYSLSEKSDVELTILSIAAKDPALLQGVIAHIGAANLPLVRVERLSK